VTKSCVRGLVVALFGLGCLWASSGYGQVVDTRIPLNYNFHGMAHVGETTSSTVAPFLNADGAFTFRSISDRGLVFDFNDTASVGYQAGDGLITATGMTYRFFDVLGYGNTTAVDPSTSGLDIVHLGDRSRNAPFEAVINTATNIGINPQWQLAGTTNQTGAQTTTLASPITIDATTEIGVLYNISNSGGQFDIILGFTDSTTLPAIRVAAPDWVGVQSDPTILTNNPISFQRRTKRVISGTTRNAFHATTNNDNASMANYTSDASPSINCIEAIISIPLVVSGTGTYPATPSVVGKQLNSITFQNPTWPTKSITALTGDGSFATATVSAHGYSVGDPITVAGVTPAGYNGSYTVAQVVDANTFKYANTTTGTTSGTRTVFRPGDGRGYAIFAATARTGSTTCANPILVTTVNNVADVSSSNLHPSIEAPSGFGTNDTTATWFSYTASANVPVIASTCTTAIDTTIAVYGTCGGAAIVGNDNTAGCGTNGSKVIWNATSGQTYYIRVAGNNAAKGTFTLHLEDFPPPPNNTCLTASPIAPGDTNGDTAHGIPDGVTAACGNGTDTIGLWYTYTASSNGNLEFRTCRDGVAGIDPQVRGITGVTTVSGASSTVVLPTDTTIAVFTGSCGSLTPVAGGCNDDGCSVTSRVRFAATNGTTYLIRVAIKGGGTGTFVLHFDDIPHTDLTMPLQFNWNGICHGTTSSGPLVSEQTIPSTATPVIGQIHENRSDLNGFRSIADRGLLFDPNGTTTNALNYGGTVGYQGMVYSLYNTALQSDMIHLGNRALAAGGIRNWSVAGTQWPASGGTATTNNGLRPLWINNDDQTTPQTSSMTGLSAVFGANTKIGILYHISNVDILSGTTPREATFDVTLSFTDATNITVRVQGSDWFGGASATPYNQVLPGPTAGVEAQRVLGIYNGVQNTDKGDPASTGPLKVDEAVISTSSLQGAGFNPTGKTLSAITFGNLRSGNAAQDSIYSAVGIYAATLRDPASFNLNFPPGGTGTATPNQLTAGSTGKLTVAVSRGSGSPNNITSVIVDASSVGLSSTLALNDSGTGGDTAPNDNLWSRSISFPVNTPPGAFSLPFTVTDAQGRQATGNIIFSIVAPTGAVTPATVIVGSVIKVTVTMSNGGVATPNISSVTVDASGLGLGTLTLLDNGTGGDVTANNGVYSADVAIPFTTSPGAVTLPFTVTDLQANSYQGNLPALTVTLPTATLTPTTAVVGSEPKITVTMQSGGLPATNIASVEVDASAIGAGTVALNDAGLNGDTTANDGIYSRNVRIPLTATPGVVSMSYTATDLQSNVFFGNLANLTVSAPAAAIAPNPAFDGATIKYTVNLNSGAIRATNITSVTIDASGLTLGNNIALLDDGTGGDVTSADGIYSADLVLPPGALTAATQVPYAVHDSLGGTFNGSVTLNPTVVINLGNLVTGATTQTDFIAAGAIVWFKFTLTSPVSAGSGTFLDIDTEGSTLTPTNDTELGLYTSAGNLVNNGTAATDDDSGSGLLTQLTFGVTSPARPAVGDGLAYNGRHGDLPAGTYFLALTGFNGTFNTTNFNVTSTSTYSGTYVLNLKLGSVPAGGPPAVFTDLGTVASGNSVTNTQALASGGVQWFKFNIPANIDGNNPTRLYFDIDTEGSVIANTVIGLFRDDGSGTLVGTDDNDGSGNLSQLTYGRGSRAAVGDGLAYNGRDGLNTLTAGTYYLAVTEASATFGNNFIVFFNTGTTAGDVTVNLRSGFQGPIIYGADPNPVINPANGHRYYLLEQGMTWTDAEAFAVTLGGHLATINDSDENEWVRTNILGFDATDRRGWIGFNDQDVEGTFVWSSGETPGYTNWNTGEPNNGGAGEDYAELLGSNGFWNDLANAGVAAGDFAVVEVGAAAPVPGDLNCDNVLNVSDIPAFIMALINPAGYATNFPGCDIQKADVNNDAAINGKDISPFVHLLAP